MITPSRYLRTLAIWRGCASRVGADALANLPSRARWFPQGDAAIRQRNGSCDRQPSTVKPMEGFFMSKKTETNVVLDDGGPELTSAGVPWSEVPELARADVAWMDGRHGSAQSTLPPVDVVPVCRTFCTGCRIFTRTGPADRGPCSMPQGRERDCGMCVLALGSSVLSPAGA